MQAPGIAQEVIEVQPSKTFLHKLYKKIHIGSVIKCIEWHAQDKHDLKSHTYLIVWRMKHKIISIRD